ncbi:MAG TPA: serine hydrolase domain-containing protein [Gemmatimonadaceae bacterium]|nr:serine hydrolase domain-containing protein [Gemmatimonadaceae bacterium]
MPFQLSPRHRMRRLVPTAMLAACLTPDTAPSQTRGPIAVPDSARLAAVLDSIRQAIGATGATAAVIFADGNVWQGVAGHAWAGEPVTAQTVFDVGSITKSYTAALILRLVADGALSLDDQVTRWLPDLADAGGVTLRHLLQQTSGLADYAASPQFMPAIRTRMAGAWPPEENLRFVGPRHAPPDSVWRYSNTNYLLLGLVARQAAGKPYASLLRSRVLAPLQLRGTFVAGEDSIVAPRAHAFLDINGDGRADDLSALVPDPAMTRGSGGAGAVVATAGDVARFARAYYSGAFLGAGLHREVTTWRDRGDGWRYGFGVIANPRDDDVLLGHLGNTAGQSAGVWHSTRHGVTAVILTNAHGVRMADAVEALLRESSGAGARRP